MRKNENIIFDQSKADRVIKFCECLKHVKGPKAGQKFILEPWQKELLSKLYGTVYKDTGLRVYRKCTIFLGRKNGKSFLASALVLYHLLADNEGGPEVYSAASTFLQASLIFDSCSEIVRKNPSLSSRIKVNDGRKVMKVINSNGVYRSLTSSGDSLMGLNPSLVVVDEIHTITDRNYIDTLLTAQGARAQPLFLTISTAGFNPNSVGKAFFDYAKDVADGVIEDETMLPCIYAADPTDDPADPATWKKANPNLGVSISEDFLKSEWNRALQEPSYINSFKTLYLNIWCNSQAVWLRPTDVDACYKKEPPSAEALINAPCILGLDLSSTTDLTSLSIYFPTLKYAKNISFIPSDNATEKERADNASYNSWADSGYIIKTNGNVIDYTYIRDTILNLCKKYRVELLAYDPWNATQLAVQLEQSDGLNVIPVRQGFQSLSSPTKLLEKMIIGHEISIDNNPVLRWSLNNAAVVTDVNENIRLVKKAQTTRIDPVMSLITAMAGYELSGLSTAHKSSIYETESLFFL